MNKCPPPPPIIDSCTSRHAQEVFCVRFMLDFKSLSVKDGDTQARKFAVATCIMQFQRLRLMLSINSSMKKPQVWSSSDTFYYISYTFCRNALQVARIVSCSNVSNKNIFEKFHSLLFLFICMI